MFYLTGLTIATCDNLITPLEKLKFQAIVGSKEKLSFKRLYQEGWKGITIHWIRSSVTWPTFLVSQKYFRTACQEKAGCEPLSIGQLIGIGVLSAYVVSVVANPLDVMHARKQALDLKVSSLFSGHVLKNFYRGWPLNFVLLVGQNVPSAILMNWLEHKS